MDKDRIVDKFAVPCRCCQSTDLDIIIDEGLQQGWVVCLSCQATGSMQKTVKVNEIIRQWNKIEKISVDNQEAQSYNVDPQCKEDADILYWLIQKLQPTSSGDNPTWQFPIFLLRKFPADDPVDAVRQAYDAENA